MVDIAPPPQMAGASRVRSLLATHRDAEDLIQIGAYVPGTSPAIDDAVTRLPAITAFLRQPLDECTSLDDSAAALAALVQ
jgi:flagellum-specific ATP synthase